MSSMRNRGPVESADETCQMSSDLSGEAMALMRNSLSSAPVGVFAQFRVFNDVENHKYPI